MQESELQRIYRQMLGLRVGPEMARYVLARLRQGTAGEKIPGESIPVMGGDARTGLPLRREIDADMLRAMLPPGH